MSIKSNIEAFIVNAIKQILIGVIGAAVYFIGLKLFLDLIF